MQKIMTTTIGAWPKPDFVKVPDWFDDTDTPNPTAGWADAVAAMGEESEAIFCRGVRSAIDDQINVGIDIPTDGEIRRENYIHYHCRHLEGFDFENLTRKKARNGAFDAWFPTIRAPVRLDAPILVAEWNSAQSMTDRPLKITLPGPLTISDTTVDDYYHDSAAAGRDIADALNKDVVALADAGCKHIQIDEPVFARQPQNALEFGFENLERAFHGCPADVDRVVHMCCGYPNGIDLDDYPKADRDSYRKLARAIDDSCIDSISLEDAHRHVDLDVFEMLPSTKVILGVIAIAKSKIEQHDAVVARVRSVLDHIDRDRLIVAPDCGLGILGRELAMSKLSVMRDAVNTLNT